MSCTWQGQFEGPFSAEQRTPGKSTAVIQNVLASAAILAAMALCGCTESGPAGGSGSEKQQSDAAGEVMHPVLGDWERTVILGYTYSTGAANTQVDRYTFHADGTFDHSRRLDFLTITSGQSGVWREEQGRIVCEAELEIESRAYRDLLLLSADGTELMDLANRARGVPACYRPDLTQPAPAGQSPAVTVPFRRAEYR